MNPTRYDRNLSKIAHDSGDGETIYHCGAAETRFLTPEGVRTLGEMSGLPVRVLSGGLSDSRGQWVDAHVHPFGKQRLWKVILRRNKIKKVIRATAEHRWLVRRPDRVVLTRDLKPNHRLAHIRAERYSGSYDHEAVRRGFHFGDGTVQVRGEKTYGAVTLWGNKRDIAPFFREISETEYPVQTDSGIDGIRFISGMKGYEKILPPLTESYEFLYGWLKGYMCADGSVYESGQVTLSSSILENLEHVRDICTLLGIGSYAPTMHMRKGYGEEETPIFEMGFSIADFSKDFFVRSDHRDNFRGGTRERMGWVVESVEETDDIEEVYCAVVPGNESFALEDNIHWGNCPFCGSGQVLARSDRTIECAFCFAGETEYLTPEGVKTFKETVGTTQKVLSHFSFKTQVGKGRSRRGNPQLSDSAVIEMRDLYATGLYTKAELARRYDIVQGSVKKIVERISWQHLGGGGHPGGEGPTQEALYGEGHSTFAGQWVDAEIRAFGQQRLWKVLISRMGIEKEIYATAEHRWIVHPEFGSAYKYKQRVVRTTEQLAPGARLASLFTQTRVKMNKDTVPSPFGVAHGFVWGDGSLDGRGGSKVTLWGEKDRALLPYYSASRKTPVENKNGTKGIEVKDLPSFFKSIPDFGESLSYLYGWLAGYFAADGDVSEGGSVNLSCAHLDDLNRVRDLCTVLGIGTYAPTYYERIGLGQTEPTPIWSMRLLGQNLTSDFFIIPEHRERFDRRDVDEDREPPGWTVVSVEETDREEEVYCAVVPGHENFTLVDNINVMNCHVCFTVQIQPQFPAFPQTINGQPVQVPGMPGQIGGGADLGAGIGGPGFGEDAPIDPTQVDEEGNVADADSEADPDAAPGADQDGAADDGAEDEDSGGDGSPWAKKSSLSPMGERLYRTAKGHWLTEHEYRNHLAISNASNPRQMAAMIKEARSR